MNDAANTLPRTVKTFKSQRAATMAVNKADKAYEAAVRAEAELWHQPRPCGDDPELDAVKAFTVLARENLKATVKTAEAQGFSTPPNTVDYWRRNASLRGEEFAL